MTEAVDNRSPKRSLRIDDQLWLALNGYSASRNEPVARTIRRAIIALLEQDDWPTRVPVSQLKRRMKDAERNNTKGRLPDRQHLTATEAAKYFEVTRATIYNWVKAGKLKPVKTDAGAADSTDMYFDIDELKLAVSEKRPHRPHNPRVAAKTTRSTK